MNPELRSAMAGGLRFSRGLTRRFYRWDTNLSVVDGCQTLMALYDTSPFPATASAYFHGPLSDLSFVDQPYGKVIDNGVGPGYFDVPGFSRFYIKFENGDTFFENGDTFFDYAAEGSKIRIITNDPGIEGFILKLWESMQITE